MSIPGSTSPRVDVDVHVRPRGPEALHRFLPPRWEEFVRKGWMREPYGLEHSFPSGTWAGLPAVPPGLEDGPDERVVEELCRRVLDEPGVDVAVLGCYYGLESLRNPDLSVALVRALNDWLIEERLGADERLLGSIVLPMRDPAAAAEEVRRVGSHPRVVQAYCPVRTERPYGNRFYYPLYEALCEEGLVLGVHFGGLPGNPPTPSGWPTYYIEEYVGMAQVFQTQLTSMVVEGVFDAFPSLRATMIDAGYLWLPSLMWRLDKEWKGLRRETPWLRQPPSAYLRDHVRFTTLPVDQPQDAADLANILAQMGEWPLLLYGSDYPRDHGDANHRLLEHLPAAHHDDVLGAEAVRWYGLGDRAGLGTTAGAGT